MGNDDMEKNTELWKSYYQENGTYVNKENISDADELERFERNMTETKLNELHENPIKGNYDIKHLCDIHKYLFEDLYEWAGKYRNVDMKINGRVNHYFSPVDKIDEFLKEDIILMHKEMGNVYNLDTLADFITNHYVALVNVHPFRDGNGRSIREFLREFVVDKTLVAWGDSFDIDWSLANHKLIDELMPFGRAYSGAIKMEVKKTIVPFYKENGMKM